jgi:hypothetical protein
LSILLGITGLTNRVVGFILSVIKLGIAAVILVIKEGGGFDQFPLTISSSVGLAFYLIFSSHFTALRECLNFRESSVNWVCTALVNPFFYRFCKNL